MLLLWELLRLKSFCNIKAVILDKPFCEEFNLFTGHAHVFWLFKIVHFCLCSPPFLWYLRKQVLRIFLECLCSEYFIETFKRYLCAKKHSVSCFSMVPFSFFFFTFFFLEVESLSLGLSHCVSLHYTKKCLFPKHCFFFFYCILKPFSAFFFFNSAEHLTNTTACKTLNKNNYRSRTGSSLPGCQMITQWSCYQWKPICFQCWGVTSSMLRNLITK